MLANEKFKPNCEIRVELEKSRIFIENHKLLSNFLKMLKSFKNAFLTRNSIRLII